MGSCMVLGASIRPWRRLRTRRDNSAHLGERLSHDWRARMRVEHSMSHFLRAIGWIALCTSAAHAQHMHMLDDGAPNRGVTWSQPADFVWLQSFEASATGDSILQVSLMFPIDKLLH